MKVLDRYLRRELLGATALVLVAFVALFAVFDFLAELDDLGRGNYRLKHVLLYVLLSLPGRAYEIVPIAALIGTLLALTMLARHSELTVMRTSGVSLARLMRSLLGTGLIIALLTAALGEFAVPPLERAAQRWRMMSTQSTVRQSFHTGTWLRDAQLVVNIRRAYADGRLEDIRVYEFDAASRLLAINTAPLGEFSGDGLWRLLGATQTRFSDKGVSVVAVPTLEWPSSLTAEMVSLMMVTPERLSIRSLYPYVKHMRDTNQRVDRYEIALWKKLLYPFAALVMMALALPFVLGSNQRATNVGGRVLLGVILGMGFHLLNGLFSNLGIINAWPAFWSATAPSLLFLVAAVAMLKLTERR